MELKEATREIEGLDLLVDELHRKVALLEQREEESELR